MYNSSDMYYLLLVFVFFSISPVFASSEKEVINKIKSNLFIPHESKKSKKQALINFDINNEGKSENINIEDNGVSEDIISRCLLAITKSEPFAYNNNHVTFFCENKREILEKDFKKVSKKYMKRVEKKIKANWFPIKNKTSYQAGLGFKLARNGSVSDIKILQSSGNESNDITAIKAVEMSSPFDPVPEILLAGEESVDIEYTFDYNSRQKSSNLEKINFGLNILDLMN